MTKQHICSGRQLRGPHPGVHDLCRILLCLVLVSVWFCAVAWSAQTDGVHCSVITDQDGDEVILMESEWISMHLLPRMQAIINRFVFRPTGNDIVEVLVPKIRMNGGGILMDCFWEQDWRFQELKEKPYTYKITKAGPDEAQAVFETDIVGWVGSDNSGVISRLLSEMTLRRTVTLKAGQPFFRFDFEFIDNDKVAKRPTFWVHNSSCVDAVGMESVLRPSARAILEIKGLFRGDQVVSSPPYVRDFNHGWSARIARHRREGIVYLMDYDYVQMLYNCYNTTSEWMYDGILSLPRDPWKGHVYILPMIGLSGVDYANEYFICQLVPSREDGVLRIEYRVTSSYENAAQVTFNTEVEHNLLPEAGETPQSVKLKPVTVEGLGLQPSRAAVDLKLDAPDPLVFNIIAYVELPDGEVKKFPFQHYYTGDYDSGQGINTQRNGKPVRLLERPVRRPRIPEPPANASIDNSAFRVFGVFGLGSERMGVRRALTAEPGLELDIGYCTGQDAYGYALGDFPYDYDRLFKYRVLVFSNAQLQEIRSIGGSVLMPWIKVGGGLVFTGGEHAFNFEFREHDLNRYLPLKPRGHTLQRGLRQLSAPVVPDHPVFRDLDFSNRPWLLYTHDIQLKDGSDARVLMKIGDFPFVVEKKTNGQTTMIVACNHFGAESDMDGKQHLRNWSEWPKLLANVVCYAGGGLK